MIQLSPEQRRTLHPVAAIPTAIWLIILLALKWGTPIELWTILVLIFQVVFNNIFQNLNFRIPLGRFSFLSMSDTGVLIVWLLNLLVLTPSVVIGFRLSPFEIFGGWLLCSVTAQLHLESLQKKKIILTASTLSFICIVVYLEGSKLDLDPIILILSTFIAITTTFYKLEKGWQDLGRKNSEIENREAETRLELAGLQTNAMIGIQTKTVLHEIDNIIQAMMLAPKNPQEQLVVISDSVAHIRKVKNLVMKPLTRNNTHEVDVGAILDDVNFIIKKYVLAQFIKWDTDIDKEAMECVIREKEGAMYCMLLNIAKNCCEALQQTAPDLRRISFKVKSDERQVIFGMSDNGPGMKESLLNSLRKGVYESSKGSGRGNGLRFVHETCNSLGFRFEIDSKLGEGGEFRIIAPCLPHSES